MCVQTIRAMIKIIWHRGARVLLEYESQTTWALSQYKDSVSRYKDFHYKDKASWLFNGNSYTDKLTNSYWDDPLLYFIVKECKKKCWQLGTYFVSTQKSPPDGLTHCNSFVTPYDVTKPQSTLDQVMACRLFRTKAFPESVLTWCYLDPWKQTYVKFES